MERPRMAQKRSFCKRTGKQLRWTVHSDLNRLTTAGRLCYAYVAPRVSLDCKADVRWRAVPAKCQQATSFDQFVRS